MQNEKMKRDLDHETKNMQNSTEEDFRIGIGSGWLYQYINEASIKFAEGAKDSGPPSAPSDNSAKWCVRIMSHASFLGDKMRRKERLGGVDHVGQWVLDVVMRVNGRKKLKKPS